MLYIFDMGNVIIDIDFNRVFAVWSKLSGVPLANIKKNFTTGEIFKLHEQRQYYRHRICRRNQFRIRHEFKL